MKEKAHTMHPDDEEMLLYIEDKLPVGTRELLEAHIGQCGPCATRFADLSRLPLILEGKVPVQLDEAVLRKARALVQPGKPGRPQTFFSPVFRPAFAAAAAVVLILSVYLFVQEKEPAEFRSDKVDELRTLIMFPDDGATVIDPATRFRWTSVGESMVYKFSLLRETGAVVWSNDVRDTSIALPSSIVLQPGKTYLWRVETFLADKTLGRSVVHAFTYTPQ